jgi:hypothetical protein
MPAYVDHARAIAAELATLDGVLLVPDPPVTPMMHVYLRGQADRLDAVVRRIAVDRGLWTWPKTFTTELPGWRVVELSVGDATMEFAPGEVRALVAEILAG